MHSLQMIDCAYRATEAEKGPFTNRFTCPMTGGTRPAVCIYGVTRTRPKCCASLENDKTIRRSLWHFPVWLRVPRH